MVFAYLTVAVTLIGGIKSLKMRRKIERYEQLHGPLPKCLGRACRWECSYSQATQNSAVETPETPSSPVTGDYVMIPMQPIQETAVSSPQRVQQPVVFSPQPVVFQNQNQPLLVAQNPQQFNQNPQQFNQVPLVYAFPPQQNGNNLYPQPMIVAPQYQTLPQQQNYVFRN